MASNITPSTADLGQASIAVDRRQTRPLALSVWGPSSFNEMTDDFLRVASFQGKEGISQHYQFQLQLNANDIDQLSPDQVTQLAQFNTQDLLGLWATVRLGRPWQENRFERQPTLADPSWEDNTPSRFFQGVVSAMTMAAPGVYQMVIASPLQPLTLRNRYTIYENCNLQDLFTQLLANETASGRLTLDFRFSGLTITRRQDWLQAGESDFAFLQRVASRASVYFYFIHDALGATLVFCNRATAKQEVAIPGCQNQVLALRYSYTNSEQLGAQPDDLFCDMSYQVKSVQEGVRLVLAREPASWETNEIAKYSTSEESSEQAKQEPAQYTVYRRYVYGASAEEAEGQLVKTQQKLATEQGTLSGTVTSSLLSPGYTFELTEPLASHANGLRLMREQFSGRTFVVTTIEHKAGDTMPYSGSVQATEVTPDTNAENGTLLTPFNMDNTHQGSVMAVVQKTAVPRGWRYREKSNYQIEQSKTEIGSQGQSDYEKYKEKGCLVSLATQEKGGSLFWVRLGQSMQTAPEVGSVVMVSRANNDSEVPEINVVSSHGSKIVNPPD